MGSGGHFGWYITGFGDLVAAKRVILTAQVEITDVTAAVSGNYLSVFTYGSQEVGGVDIETKGRSIDKQEDVAITITPVQALNIDFRDTFKKPVKMVGA